MLTLGKGVFDTFAGMRAQKDQQAIAIQNLYETRRANRATENLAKADRTDAYGNTVGYTEGIGFETELTALQQAIMGSQQTEQLAQFREDAPRQRNAAVRQDNRSQEADELYNERFNEQRYARRKTQEEYEAEAILQAVATQGDGTNEAVDQLSRAAMRMGNSSEIPALVAAIRGGAQPSLDSTINTARNSGTERFFAETGARQQMNQGELQALQGTADTTSTNSLDTSNQNTALSGRSDGALEALIAANNGSRDTNAQALAGVQQAAGQPTNIDGLANGLAGLFPEGQGSQGEQKLAQLLLEQQLNQANLGRAQSGAALSSYRGNSANF
jgi:hypothetical protein